LRLSLKSANSSQSIVIRIYLQLLALSVTGIVAFASTATALETPPLALALRNITRGSNGTYNCKPNYDDATGIGSPKGNS
jgi:hypothetical protein